MNNKIIVRQFASIFCIKRTLGIERYELKHLDVLPISGKLYTPSIAPIISEQIKIMERCWSRQKLRHSFNQQTPKITEDDPETFVFFSVVAHNQK